MRLAPVFAQAPAAYTFDASNSSIQLDVYKEGLFSALAHNHLIQAKDFSGTAQFDSNNIQNSSVTLRVAAKSLTVIDPGVSANDRQQVQATMLGNEVLDVARYPEISFHSTGVTQIQRQGTGWRVTLAGVLELHGTRRPIEFPLTVQIQNGQLLAQGDAFLLQTDFGITPVRIAGGTVKVKNRLRIRFDIHASAEFFRGGSAGPSGPRKAAP